MRILITGSREFRDESIIRNALVSFVTANGKVIVHGDCPSGADKIAKQWALEYQTIYGPEYVKEESHAADWFRECDKNCYHPARFSNGRPICSFAGFVRNQEMVDLGADICLAFFKKGAQNRGTNDCARRARVAGIKVVKFWEPK